MTEQMYHDNLIKHMIVNSHVTILVELIDNSIAPCWVDDASSSLPFWSTKSISLYASPPFR